MNKKYLSYIKSINKLELVEETRQKISTILANYFPKKYKLKGIQEAVVTSTILKHDTFVRMPTGSGKSLCYQLPAMHDEGITVVFSPLISLIRDQTTKLKKDEYSIPCTTFNARRMQRIIKGNDINFKLLYITPEKAVKHPRFLPFLRNLHKKGLLSRFVIDEAHCVSQWGSTFRPDYIKLGGLLEKFRRKSSKRVPIMALTATSSLDDCKEVIDLLKMDKKCENELMFKSRMERRNLGYKVIAKKKETLKQLVEYYLQKYSNGTGIIYCMTIRESERIAKLLGEIARPYNSKMSEKKKKIFQDAWMNGEIQVICATSAFGMGIDKANVNFVIHNSIPRSFADYLQESGRAGRDGKPAECVVLYNFNDQFRVLREIAANKFINLERREEIIKRKQNDLRQIVDYCQANCVDLPKDGIELLSIMENQCQLSPSKFLQPYKKLRSFELTKEEEKQIPDILNAISKIGKLRMSKLMESFPGNENLIQSLIMNGFLRISLDTNSYRKCSPILSLSSMGQSYLESPAERKEYSKESLKELELESIEIGEFFKQFAKENYSENHWQHGFMDEYKHYLPREEAKIARYNRANI